MAQSIRQQSKQPTRLSFDEDEFGDDDLMLDEAAEQSLQQIEDAFQTQILSQSSNLQEGHSRSISLQQQKRHRSPSVQNDVSSTNKHQRTQDPRPPITLSQSIDNQRSEEHEKIIERLNRQLAEKDRLLQEAQKENLSKTGEVEIVRRRLHEHVSETGKLLLQKEESIQKNLNLAEKFKEANETLISENKTLKSFRSMEVGTSASNQLWSSVNASVARRRHGAINGQRDYSQSHSQSMAASVGLTTPTKRNGRQSTRAIGSSSGGGRSPGSGHLNPDESPSARARRRQETSMQIESEKRSSRKAAFPGFINSFAKPILAKETQPAIKKKINGVRNAVQSMEMADEAVFQDNVGNDIPMLESSSSPARSIIRTEQPSSPSEIRVGGHAAQSSPLPAIAVEPPLAVPIPPSRWSDPKIRQMWASKKYSDRQAFLSSLILGHESNPRSTTLQRLLDVNLPINQSRKTESLQVEYTLAVHHFLLALSNASFTEERFEFLLEEFEEMEEEKRQAYENREDYERMLLFDCLQEIDEGIYEVIQKVFRELQIMLAITSKVEIYDRMFDILSLMRSIIIHFPAGIAGLADEGLDTTIYYDANEEKEKMTQQIQIDDVETQEESQIEQPELQRDAESSLRRRQERRLDLRIERILLSGLRWACITDGTHKDQKNSLLNAIVGILELMAHQCTHNDVVSLHCTQMLKCIFEETGILISLLVENDGETPRSSNLIQKVLAILTHTCQHDSLWRVALASKPAIVERKEGLIRAPIRFKDHIKEEGHIDIFDNLSNFLMMERKVELDIHGIHHSIIIFLSQLATLQPLLGSPLIVQSKSILAAIVKSLQLDTDFIWNEEQFSIGIKSDILTRMIKSVKRISLDIRFMSLIYNNIGEDNQKLAKQLSSSSIQYILNGVRHSFIVALSLIAFASEPDWMQILMDVDEKVEEARVMLNDVNEMAADLLELVLSPDEIEACYDALVEEEEEVDEESLEEDERQKEIENITKQKQKQQQSQTQTQTQTAKQHVVGEVINLDSDDDDNDVQMM